MKPVIVGDEAAQDIARAVIWYEAQRPGLGNRCNAAMAEVLLRIEQLPGSFRSISRPPLQRAPVTTFPYVVFFRETETHVTVVAVLHTSRNIRPLLNRRLRGAE